MKFDIFHVNDKILALYALSIISNVTSNKNELERLLERLTSFENVNCNLFQYSSNLFIRSKKIL